MESYVKGQIIDPPDLKAVLPFKNLPETFIHMTVKPGSKVKNIMGFAIGNFQKPENGLIIFSGSGQGITKTISCAEIMKKRFKELGLQQLNKIHYIACQEMWDPTEKDLDILKVNRDIPAIHILLSKTPLDEKEPGFQAPGTSEAFWKNPNLKPKSHQNKRNPKKPSGSRKGGPPRTFKPRKQENPSPKESSQHQPL